MVIVLSIEEGEGTMKKNDKDVTVGLSELKRYDEVRFLNSCISRYFRGATGLLPLKEEDSFILSALTIYFQGNVNK